ncbi:MAG TPA: 4-alpha-glucanotransferase, partial [Polyangiales bacterium]|nr:4-alpha-glucanotransferase [Polyangiales bacterium]
MPAAEVGAAGVGGPDFVRDALRRLGVRRFVLGVHASAFPADALDVGYGAPLTDAGERLLRFAAQLGFNALQLGPTGQISTFNLSPYDGTVFARNTWTLGLAALASEAYAGLLPLEDHEWLAEQRASATRVQPERAARCIDRVLETCHARFRALRSRAPEHPFVVGFADFRREQAPWLEVNALYEAIAARAGDDPTRFEPALQALFEPGAAGRARRSALRSTLGEAIERSELAQYLCHAQHAAFRERAHGAGLQIWGDLQVGFSHRDRFLHRECFADHWLLGAPPSRTNPHGQPWGYPLLAPDQLDDPESPARQLFLLRLRKLLAEHDGVRIDHPHGLVCPWVYRAGDPDAYHAVRHGARAFCSPDSTDPDLTRWAIAQRADLNPAAHSHFADNWISRLEAAQVARYSRLFDVLASLCHGPMRDTFAAEVLSTSPYPLCAVLERHGLGRFRVTQKVDPRNPADVYRTEHARPEDWLMLGTHDTPPALEVVERWRKDGSAPLRAAYLAERLIAAASERAAAAQVIAASERNLACASLADLFASAAENVYVFVGDLFGEREPFNRAGVVHPDNWTARLPADFESIYAARLREGRALDIQAA